MSKYERQFIFLRSGMCSYIVSYPFLLTQLDGEQVQFANTQYSFMVK